MAGLLKGLLPVRAVHLSATAGVDRVCILSDETELLPGLPLGDVLVEELGIDVPYGTAIVISEEDGQDGPTTDEDMSYNLGMVVGNALLDVISRNVFPLHRESSALYVMGCSYHSMASGSGLQHLGLKPAHFRAGLAASLGAFWSGAQHSRVETSGLFLQQDFLASPRLRRYLATIDAGFSAPRPEQIGAGLMHFPGGARSYDQWLGLVQNAVMDRLGAHTARLCDS
ncbi:hypothetical protein [Actibacterium sp. MT2.3-13A]|uniref:hypothetical protein n=1 Tax=Actibacterium sp. MT2.3-13A TaxID=2828332 RepID=UPI001BA4728E|nr:hypothetical protein [Actibacterium sp. MT2.3-13A]